MEIAVVGGGPTGLVAALRLAQKGHSVTVFEKENQLGGLASSFKADGWDWPAERYFHHYFISDEAIKKLARELNLEKKLFYLKPKTSVYLNGKILRFDNPQSLLLFPYLGLIDKFRTGLTILFLKLNPFWQPLQNISAAAFIKKTMGERTFQLIWQPLLQSKFGAFADQITASWFWARIRKRSFALGYFIGGSETLLAALTDKIKENGGHILLGQTVTRIQKTPAGFTLYLQDQPSKLKFDKVIATVPPAVLVKIAPDLPAAEKKALNSLKSLGSLCLVLALKESFLAEGTYWLNVNESRFPFVAVVEHTNLVDKKHYQQNTLLYVGGYYPTTHPFFHQSKTILWQKFLPYLKKINPAFDFDRNLIQLWLFKDGYSQPVVSGSQPQNPPSITTPIRGLYWACLHHVYPEDRGVNYAILLGEKVADETVS
jgi:protoporphyrinogen oxidase